MYTASLKYDSRILIFIQTSEKVENKKKTTADRNDNEKRAAIG